MRRRTIVVAGVTVAVAGGTVTAAALNGFSQDDVGLPETGTVAAGQVVFLPGEVRVADAKAEVGPARLRPADLLRVGTAGMRTRPPRAVLSGLGIAIGIAIGIATMVAVVGISSSSRADLMRQLDELGTNLLTVSAGRTLLGEDAALPKNSVAMVGRVGPVRTASAGDVDANVYRTDRIPEARSGGIAVRATTLDLPETLDVTVGSGAWLNAATERYPAVVLGSVAARRLGVASAGGQVWLGDRWFTVVGILDPVPLASDIDRTALDARGTGLGAGHGDTGRARGRGGGGDLSGRTGRAAASHRGAGRYVIGRRALPAVVAYIVTPDTCPSDRGPQATVRRTQPGTPLRSARRRARRPGRAAARRGLGPPRSSARR